ncbi:hypothetical protein Q1695_005300 [Nippostrongylus brasiliensis]|nr:hypothetical protein Q1695_005300 [Nippostrongylus brasiliensis]
MFTGTFTDVNDGFECGLIFFDQKLIHGLQPADNEGTRTRQKKKNSVEQLFHRFQDSILALTSPVSFRNLMLNIAHVRALLFLLPTLSARSPHPKVLLISFDGFRYDLLNSSTVPNIYNAAREGVWFTEGVSPQYVTMTSTNHMGLSTGLHAESHGVVGNVFYEKSTLRKFDYFNLSHTPGVIKDSKDPQWVRGEPIWVTNEKADATRHSACLYWPLGDIQFPNAEMPKFFKAWKDYGTLKEWKQDVDTIVEFFNQTESPMNFVAWYVSEPDHTLHENGFFNGELPKTLKQLDEVFGYLIERLSTEELLDQINIVFTADHGHSEIEGTKKMMCIKDYVDYNRVHYAERMLYANDEETIQEAYRNLTRAQKDFKFKMYFRNDTVLKRYFYTKMPDRIGDIVLEPEVGYEVGNKCSKKELRMFDSGMKKFNSSTHGQAPENREMRAVLFIRGPAVDPLQMTNPVQVIDIYNMMCALLEIQPAPNNGSTARIGLGRFMKSQKSMQYNEIIMISVAAGTVPMMIIIVAMLYICLKSPSEVSYMEESAKSSSLSSEV